MMRASNEGGSSNSGGGGSSSSSSGRFNMQYVKDTWLHIIRIAYILLNAT
jgi:hypothetical protein